jgi:hypothetical protein
MRGSTQANDSSASMERVWPVTAERALATLIQYGGIARGYSAASVIPLRACTAQAHVLHQADKYTSSPQPYNSTLHPGTSCSNVTSMTKA